MKTLRRLVAALIATIAVSVMSAQAATVTPPVVTDHGAYWYITGIGLLQQAPSDSGPWSDWLNLGAEGFSVPKAEAPGWVRLTVGSVYSTPVKVAGGSVVVELTIINQPDYYTVIGVGTLEGALTKDGPWLAWVTLDGNPFQIPKNEQSPAFIRLVRNGISSQVFELERQPAYTPELKYSLLPDKKIFFHANIRSGEKWILEQAAAKEGPWTVLDKTFEPQGSKVLWTKALVWARLRKADCATGLEPIRVNTLGLVYEVPRAGLFKVSAFIWESGLVLQESSDLINWESRAVLDKTGYTDVMIPKIRVFRIWKL